MKLSELEATTRDAAAKFHFGCGRWANYDASPKLRAQRLRIIGPTAVSQYSFLCTASHEYRVLKFPLVTTPITIGDRVWITADVFVAPGVTIGDGAVITARSSVFNDIAPWMVAAGNPAVPVKPREWRGKSGDEGA